MICNLKKRDFFHFSVYLRKSWKIQIADLIIQRCGDMVVDPEEECDCGLPNYCRNQCCDPHTCQFSLRNPKVQCADGACCDLMVYLKNHSLGRHNIIIKFFFFSGGRLVNWNCRESNAVQRKMNAICRNTVSEPVPFARLICINTTASSVNPAKYYKVTVIFILRN